ncbi:MAG: hypothetical protein R6U04_11480 [Bacteroidales bacterium]
MEKVPFIIEELSINQMPGLQEGLNPYKNLSPAINIIAGPNASGKSSTARAIKQIIWRNNTRDLWANSRIKIDGEPWQINVNFSSVLVQKDGVDASLQGLPAEEAKERYMLALHELVRIEEKDLAQQVIQESLGGYNLEEARQKLNYSDHIPGKQIAEYKNVQHAKEKYEEIKSNQENLRNRENSLGQLEKERENAELAGKLKEFYDAMEKWLEQRQKFELVEERYKQYSPVLENMNGEELKNIEKHEREIGEANNTIAEAKQNIEDLQKELQGLDIPESGVEDRILKVIQDKAKQLENIEREIEQKDQKIVRAEKEEKEALKNLGKSLDYENWKGINLQDVIKLDEFLDKTVRVHSEKQFLETEINNLQQESEQFSSWDIDALKQGIKNLSSWLREVSFRGIEKKWIWIMSGIGLATAFAAFVWGGYGLLGLAIMAFFAFYITRSASTGGAELRKQDYLHTGLESPESWTIDEITDKIDELSVQVSDVRYKDKIEQKIDQRKEELKRLQPALQQVEKEQKSLKEKLKAAPDLPGEEVKHYSGLYYFLTYVKIWQEKHTELEALKEERKVLKNKYSQLLEKINHVFTQHNAEQIDDAVWASHTLQKIKEQEDLRRKNTDRIEELKTVVVKETERVQEKQNDLKGVYRKLGLEEGEKERVKKLVEDLEEYKEARKDYFEEQRVLKEKKKEVENHSLYTELEGELSTVTLDVAKERIAEYEKEASRKEEISNEIATIKSHLEKVKKQNDLENALKEYENALNDLEELYKSNLSSHTGNLIVNHLKQQAREHNQTSVFKRANDLFNRITKGRYELRIEEGNNPVFRAYDTVIAQGQSLEHLSTGSRIQLLLSVRLAFIEQQESTLKLPILADELLANSDDVRAKAIIDALVEISRGGRQVFYFTAQGDEVAKWKSYLDSSGNLSYKVFEIYGENTEPQGLKDYEPPFDSFELKHANIPSPENKSHEAYRQELQVPAFNLLTDPVDKIHLWYLLEDTVLLYNCLTSGVSRWGQLKSYLQNGGILEGFDKDTIQNVYEKAAILEEFQELYQQGRPRPVDRSLLEESGAVSDTFIDAVSQKLEEVNFNPEKLVKALENKEVPRFKADKITELKDFFLEKGHIDDEKPLDKDDIMVRIRARISQMNVERNAVERLIGKILSVGK